MKKILGFLLFSCLMACNAVPPSPDLETARQQILELHGLQQKYHLEKMAPEFAALMGPDFISINKGSVTMPTYEENKERFQNYFDNVDFVKWEDTEAPIIRFSDDGTMAYTVVQKEVVIRYAYEGVAPTEESTHFSWVAIYRKTEGKWSIDCVVSTNRDSSTKGSAKNNLPI